MIYQPVVEKRCSVCREWFPVSLLFFHRQKKNRYGLHSRCRTCALQKRKANYSANKERRLDYAREYRATHKEQMRKQQHEARSTEAYRQYSRNRYAQNPEHFRQKRREYHGRHREEELIRHREYNSKHREELRKKAEQRRKEYPLLAWAKQRAWERRNRDRMRSYRARRRAYKLAAGGDYTNDDVKRQYEAQQGCCFWCSKPVGKHYHVDHADPISRGGTNGPENLVISCPHCNQSKGDKIPYVEWEPPNPLKF